MGEFIFHDLTPGVISTGGAKSGGPGPSPSVCPGEGLRPAQSRATKPTCLPGVDLVVLQSRLSSSLFLPLAQKCEVPVSFTNCECLSGWKAGFSAQEAEEPPAAPLGVPLLLLDGPCLRVPGRPTEHLLIQLWAGAQARARHRVRSHKDSAVSGSKSTRVAEGSPGV